MSYAPVKGELSNSLPVQISTAEVLCWQSGDILAFSRKRAFRDTHTQRENSVQSSQWQDPGPLALPAPSPTSMKCIGPTESLPSGPVAGLAVSVMET